MNLSPISNQERIVTIDIIRGFALLGIFLVNMPSFHSPIYIVPYPDYTGMDYWLDLFFQLFISSKFYTIFSFLFGLGFYLFMSRAEQKGLQMNRLFARRLIALLVIGAVHFIFIWFGDILYTYAIGGFFLFFFYKRKIKTILIWAFSLLVLFYALISLQFLIPATLLQEVQYSVEQDQERKETEYVQTYEQAGYGEWLSYRIKTEILPLIFNLPFVLMTVGAMFLLGLAAGKARLFHQNSPFLSKLKVFWLTALILSIPLVTWLSLLKMEILNYGVYQNNAVYLFTNLSGVTLCFFYIFSFMLLLKRKTWQKWLRPFGYTGQMALTNYLMQTIISMFIFHILNYYNKVSLLEGTSICLGIFLFQLIVSSIWLKYFRFGPMEWIWRSFTYKSFQHIKKDTKVRKSAI